MWLKLWIISLYLAVNCIGVEGNSAFCLSLISWSIWMAEMEPVSVTLLTIILVDWNGVELFILINMASNSVKYPPLACRLHCSVKVESPPTISPTLIIVELEKWDCSCIVISWNAKSYPIKIPSLTDLRVLWEMESPTLRLDSVISINWNHLCSFANWNYTSSLIRIRLLISK